MYRNLKHFRYYKETVFHFASKRILHNCMRYIIKPLYYFSKIWLGKCQWNWKIRWLKWIYIAQCCGHLTILEFWKGASFTFERNWLFLRCINFVSRNSNHFLCVFLAVHFYAAIDEPTQMIEWMKSNRHKDDSAKTRHYMEQTALYRHQWITDKEKQRSMADILEEFPHLLEPGMVNVFDLFSFVKIKSKLRFWQQTIQFDLFLITAQYDRD